MKKKTLKILIKETSIFDIMKEILISVKEFTKTFYERLKKH